MDRVVDCGGVSAGTASRAGLAPRGNIDAPFGSCAGRPAGSARYGQWHPETGFALRRPRRDPALGRETNRRRSETGVFCRRGSRALWRKDFPLRRVFRGRDLLPGGWAFGGDGGDGRRWNGGTTTYVVGREGQRGYTALFVAAGRWRVCARGNGYGETSPALPVVPCGLAAAEVKRAVRAYNCRVRGIYA